jgi:hypothetical protein
MSIGKPHALRGQLVDVWRGNLATLGVVTLDVAIPEIIGIDHNNVGRNGCSLQSRRI